MFSHILNFIIGTASTAGAATVISKIDPTQFGSIEELIKYIISVAGGILATIILNILKKKFPEWFQTNKRKN